MQSNAGFYHAAYIVAAAVYVTYAVSIALRARSLRARLSASQGPRTH